MGQRVFLGGALWLEEEPPPGLELYRVHAEPRALRMWVAEEFGLPREGLIRAENLPCAMLCLNIFQSFIWLNAFFPAVDEAGLPITCTAIWLAGIETIAEALVDTHGVGQRAYQNLRARLIRDKGSAVVFRLSHGPLFPSRDRDRPPVLWISAGFRGGGARVGLHWSNPDATPADVIGQAFADAEMRADGVLRARIDHLPLPEADLLIANITEVVPEILVFLAARNILSAKEIVDLGGQVMAERR